MGQAHDAPGLAAGSFRNGTARGVAGFFRAAQDDAGRWWLLEPRGTPFYLRTVHGIRAPQSHTDGALPPDTAARLRQWGFNAVGVSQDNALRDDGLPFLASVDFASQGQPLVGPNLRLPDVFDPEWPRHAAQRAREICPPLRDSSDLIGWVTDDAIDWAPASSHGRPSLLQLCLSLEPAFPAYHAAWEFVLAHHGGRLESLARAWNASIPNKEVVRELTRAEEGLGTRGYLRDDARWTREFARRYLIATATAIRDADPNHLVLGCRFRRASSHAIALEHVYPAVDVSLVHWSELPAAAANPAQPILATDINWVTDDFLSSAPTRRPPRLTSLERMLRKARAALDRMARHPAVVGYAWAEWQDKPGEQPPFASGLIHINGAEAREHTELLAPFNARAESLHRAAE
jgi:hypothetical protein